jgi:hypothetical protein
MTPPDALSCSPSLSPEIPLPPKPPAAPPPPERLHLPAVLFVAVFAFLLGSFRERNTDLWMHLAAGRAFTDLPASHTWLYDLVCYGLYSIVGGPGLVFLKALLVVGIGLLLWRLSRTGSDWWVPAVCTALALLAMSLRLLLQPATVSYFLLALTLWLLRPRPHPQAGSASEGAPPGREPGPYWLPPWPLLVLFVIWANVASWFVLGLGTVALVWLGRLTDSRSDRPPAAGDRLWSTAARIAILAAACLLNPATIHGFALPAELDWSGPQGPGQTSSPFLAGYLSGRGLTAAGLAYFPLLVLGLLSFGLNLRNPPSRETAWGRWQRFLPWLALALLSAVQARAIPFFAVVAGPVLAWNLQDFLARQRAAGQRRGGRDLGLRAVRGLAVPLGLVFLVCAWPGWLQLPPFEPRCWTVEMPPSLEQAARVVRDWHEQGKLGDGMRGLHLSPESAHVFAWSCPADKGVLDPGVTAAIRGTPGAADDWVERVRAAGVNHVIVYDPDAGQRFVTLSRLLADPLHWPLLHLEGGVAVFGWRDLKAAGSADPFRGWQYDPNRLAFHPAADKKAPRVFSSAAPEGEAEERQWWDAFWKPAPSRSLAGGEATLHLFHANALRRPLAPQELPLLWAALTGEAAGWTVPGGGWGVPQLFQTVQWDDMPPALLYLAVRAARRAVASNPQDARAYFALGHSYLALLHSTRERTWGGYLPDLVRLRYTQASAALNRAVALKPDYAKAHLELAQLYDELGCFDLELGHMRTWFRLLHDAGPPPQGDEAAHREAESQQEQLLDRLAAMVDSREKSYAAAAAGMPVRDQAFLAKERGLAGKALDLLRASDRAEFGRPGMDLELELLLLTGRAEDVWKWTEPEQKNELGFERYHLLRTLALAATGDYAPAEAECAQLAGGLASPLGQQVPARKAVARMISENLLDNLPAGGTLPVPPLLGPTAQRLQMARGLAHNLRRAADVKVLQGLLALEEGEVRAEVPGEEGAQEAFDLALTYWRDDTRFGSTLIAQTCLEWLK